MVGEVAVSTKLHKIDFLHTSVGEGILTLPLFRMASTSSPMLLLRSSFLDRRRYFVLSGAASEFFPTGARQIR